MIYINLFAIVLCTYLAATSENRGSIVFNIVGVLVNLMAVALHLALAK